MYSASKSSLARYISLHATSLLKILSHLCHMHAYATCVVVYVFPGPVIDHDGSSKLS